MSTQTDIPIPPEPSVPFTETSPFQFFEEPDVAENATASDEPIVDLDGLVADDQIPSEFYQGLADYQAGNVEDFEEGLDDGEERET